MRDSDGDRTRIVPAKVPFRKRASLHAPLGDVPGASATSGPPHHTVPLEPVQQVTKPACGRPAVPIAFPVRFLLGRRSRNLGMQCTARSAAASSSTSTVTRPAATTAARTSARTRPSAAAARPPKRAPRWSSVRPTTGRVSNSGAPGNRTPICGLRHRRLPVGRPPPISERTRRSAQQAGRESNPRAGVLESPRSP